MKIMNLSNVFPAQAGMNRGMTVPYPLIARVPRAGGDEPNPSGSVLARAVCSPRRRG